MLWKSFTLLFILERWFIYTNIFNNYHSAYLISYFLNSQHINNIFIIISSCLKLKLINSISLNFLFIYTYYPYLNFFKVKIVEEWPTTLLVGLNTIHPYFYYTSLIYLILYNIYLFGMKPLKRKITLIFSIFIALFLGMFWGFTNTLWGYFWVNDSIELILLSIFIFSIYQVHTYRYFFNRLNIVYLCILGLYIYMLRLNILTTRHSFFINVQVASYTLYLYFFFYWKPIFLLYCIFNIFISINSVGVLVLFYYYIYYILYYFSSNIFKNLLHLIIFIYFYIWIFNLNHQTIYYYYYNIMPFIYYYYEFSLFFYSSIVLSINNVFFYLTSILLPVINSDILYFSKISTALIKLVINYSITFFTAMLYVSILFKFIFSA